MEPAPLNSLYLLYLGIFAGGCPPDSVRNLLGTVTTNLDSWYQSIHLASALEMPLFAVMVLAPGPEWGRPAVQLPGSATCKRRYDVTGIIGNMVLVTSGFHT
jgi:hypothetical protein